MCAGRVVSASPKARATEHWHRRARPFRSGKRAPPTDNPRRQATDVLVLIHGLQSTLGFAAGEEPGDSQVGGHRRRVRSTPAALICALTGRASGRWRWHRRRRHLCVSIFSGVYLDERSRWCPATGALLHTQWCVCRQPQRRAMCSGPMWQRRAWSAVVCEPISCGMVSVEPRRLQANSRRPSGASPKRPRSILSSAGIFEYHRAIWRRPLRHCRPLEEGRVGIGAAPRSSTSQTTRHGSLTDQCRLARRQHRRLAKTHASGISIAAGEDDQARPG